MTDMLVDYDSANAQFQLYEVPFLKPNLVSTSKTFGDLLHDLLDYFKNPSTLEHNYRLKATEDALNHFNSPEELKKARKLFEKRDLNFDGRAVSSLNREYKSILESLVGTHEEYTSTYLREISH